MMYRIDEINAEYTKFVRHYINAGYIINHNDMRSVHYNELCHIDFINSNDKCKLIRIWMSKRHKWNYQFSIASTINIIVKQYTINPEYNNKSLWMEDGITLYEKKFYEVDEYKKIYETELDTIKLINELRKKRYTQRSQKDSYSKHIDVTKLSDKFVKRIVDRIHENYGCKRAKADSIKEVILSLNSNRLVARVNWKFNTRSGSIVLQ